MTPNLGIELQKSASRTSPMKAGTDQKLNAVPGEEVANVENNDPLAYSSGESPPAGTG